jgi:predicted NBD/HSP70 family sugar kinase
MVIGATPSLTESSRAVLRLLAAHGAITRPRLGEMLNLSKPTMSGSIAELSAHGLVESTGFHKGAMGRTAAVYGLGPAAGYVIGIDVGSAEIRAVAHSLDGKPLATIEERLPSRHNVGVEETSALVATVAQSVISAVGSRLKILRCVAVAVPRIVATHPLHLNRRRPPEAVLRHLRMALDVPIIIENNVNCAALGELLYGAAKNRGTFAFLQVGIRVGLGIVLNGQLFRGFNGAAGEVGRIPFPWSADATPSREGLERYLGSDGLMSRCVVAWPQTEGPPPDSAKELFEAAEAGSLCARTWVNSHAADIGRLVAGCIGILDPGLVVLGGGVGQNSLLLAEVQRTARDLSWSTEIATSSLGVSGTVLGAMQLAADYGLGLILGEALHPSVVLPPLAAAAAAPVV